MPALSESPAFSAVPLGSHCSESRSVLECLLVAGLESDCVECNWVSFSGVLCSPAWFWPVLWCVKTTFLVLLNHKLFVKSNLTCKKCKWFITIWFLQVRLYCEYVKFTLGAPMTFLKFDVQVPLLYHDYLDSWEISYKAADWTWQIYESSRVGPDYGEFKTLWSTVIIKKK